MRKDTENFLLSSNYDLETAKYMHKSRRYVYVIFMCHMAIEKVLKAIVAEKSRQSLSVNLLQKRHVRDTFFNCDGPMALYVHAVEGRKSGLRKEVCIRVQDASTSFRSGRGRYLRDRACR